ncbi:MAG: 50S ribosomal protein L24 [Myxococcaceae bacterium]|jgi:large subunit ribosomal protein L24|nr:50S ribosomal protein L24 [Myxococcaceae bacterium]MCA3013386.1 50S ribosomal protein L24 [Myxococcaceae bacterium]
MQKLKVGDTVQVMSGAERSASTSRGKIIEIDRDALRVRVEGLRVVKRHVKKGRDRTNPDGGIVEKPGTIALSNVALVCPKCDKPTRTGVREVENKKKRFCKKCDATIE